MKDHLKEQVNVLIENCSIEDLKELREIIALEIAEEERKRISMDPEFEHLLLLPLEEFLKQELPIKRIRTNTFIRAVEAVNRKKGMNYLKDSDKKDPTRVYEAIGTKICKIKEEHDLGEKSINIIESLFNLHGISLNQELSEAQIEYLNKRRNFKEKTNQNCL